MSMSQWRSVPFSPQPVRVSDSSYEFRMSRSNCVARISCPVRALGSTQECVSAAPAIPAKTATLDNLRTTQRDRTDCSSVIGKRKSRPACSLTSRIALFAPYNYAACPYGTYASILALIVGTKSAIFTRVCSIVSRSRMVTVSSCEVWPSMVTQYGVPISSMRRYRLPTAPDVS